MKLTDEQLNKLLQEQAGIEGQELSESDIEAYELLFESLNTEKAAVHRMAPPGITDGVMARIVLLEEKKDRRKDAFNLIAGIFLGFLAIGVTYFYIDMPLLKACFLWIKEYFPVIAFAIIAIGLIQIADRKMVWKD